MKVGSASGSRRRDRTAPGRALPPHDAHAHDAEHVADDQVGLSAARGLDRGQSDRQPNGADDELIGRPREQREPRQQRSD